MFSRKKENIYCLIYLHYFKIMTAIIIIIIIRTEYVINVKEIKFMRKMWFKSSEMCTSRTQTTIT